MNAKVRQRAGRRWAGALPELMLWRPLHLLRRIGPVAQGVCLDPTRAGDEYYPTAHVHALTADFPVVSLTLDHRLAEPSGRRVKVSFDAGAEEIREAAEELRRQSPLSLGQPPTLAEVVRAYRERLEADVVAQRGPVPEAEDLVLVAAFDGTAGTEVEFLRRLSASWSGPPAGYASTDAWLTDLVARAADEETLRKQVESQVTSLELAKVAETGTSSVHTPVRGTECRL